MPAGWSRRSARYADSEGPCRPRDAKVRRSTTQPGSLPEPTWPGRGVAAGGGRRGVAQGLLHHVHGCAAVQAVAGTRMAQPVRRGAALQACTLYPAMSGRRLQPCAGHRGQCAVQQLQVQSRLSVIRAVQAGRVRTVKVPLDILSAVRTEPQQAGRVWQVQDGGSRDRLRVCSGLAGCTGAAGVYLGYLHCVGFRCGRPPRRSITVFWPSVISSITLVSFSTTLANCRLSGGVCPVPTSSSLMSASLAVCRALGLRPFAGGGRRATRWRIPDMAHLVVVLAGWRQSSEACASTCAGNPVVPPRPAVSPQ